MSTNTIPKKPAERREWIKYQLRIQGSSLSALARELGVTRAAISVALVRPYPRMEEAIAGKLGLTPAQLWPERAAARTPSGQLQHVY